MYRIMKKKKKTNKREGRSYVPGTPIYTKRQNKL